MGTASTTNMPKGPRAIHLGCGAVVLALVGSLVHARTQAPPSARPEPAAQTGAQPGSELRQNDAPLPGARSPRNANYYIDVRLDHGRRTLTGTATIRWRNIGTAATDVMQLHLYWNAWRNSASTWLREEQLADGDITNVRAEDWSY